MVWYSLFSFPNRIPNFLFSFFLSSYFLIGIFIPRMVSDLFPFIGEPGPSPETRQVSDRLYASTVSLRVRFPRYDRCISLLVHKVCIPVLYSIELFDSRSCSLLVYPILSPFHFIRIHSYAFFVMDSFCILNYRSVFWHNSTIINSFPLWSHRFFLAQLVQISLFDCSQSFSFFLWFPALRLLSFSPHYIRSSTSLIQYCEYSRFRNDVSFDIIHLIS